MKKPRKISLTNFRTLAQLIEDAESLARTSGLFVTMHALNRAKQAIGFEYEGNISHANKVAHGTNPVKS